MNHEEFRQAGYKIIDEIVDYYKSCKDGKPSAQVKPGYLANLVDNSIPDDPEPFSKIQQDLHEFIEPGLNHWQASNYFSYYPSTSSYPSMLAEMYSNMFNSQGFDWVCNPASSELEGIVMNWLGELIGLDDCFLSSNGGLGCGSIQATASEGNLVSMVAARDRVLKKLNSNDINGNEGADCSKLVVYASDQAHSSFIKNAKVLKLRYKFIKTDNTGAVQPNYLESQIKEDLEAGLIPCYFMLCVGSTGVSAVDNVLGCADITQKYNIWSHVDAAYAGSFFMLPEFQTYQGFKDCDSILFNPHKLMLVNFDCCGLWVKNKFEIFESLAADASYYTNPATQSGRVIDYKNLQIPLGRRFRSLKLWFVMRSYGKNGLKTHMQNQLDLAKFLVQLIEKDQIFELTHPVPFSLVCFRIKPQPGESLEANNARNEWIFTKVTETRKVIISRFVFKGQTVLRVAIGNGNHSENSISQLYELLKEYALQVDSNV